MNDQTYLQERVDEQISWLSARSRQCKRNYSFLRTFELVGAAMIPFLTAFADEPAITMIIGLLGALLAIVAGLLGLFRHQEDWTRYRLSSEALTTEKLRYQTGIAPYDGEDAFPVFFENVEALLADERTRWVSSVRAQATQPAAETEQSAGPPPDDTQPE